MLKTSPCKNKVIQFIFSESLSNLITWSCPVLARHSNVCLVCEKDFSRVPLVAMSDVKFQVYDMADPYVGQTVNGARRRNNHDVRPSGKIADLTVEQKAGDTWRCLTMMTKVDDFALRCELLDLFEYLWIAALGKKLNTNGMDPQPFPNRSYLLSSARHRGHRPFHTWHQDNPVCCASDKQLCLKLDPAFLSSEGMFSHTRMSPKHGGVGYLSASFIHLFRIGSRQVSTL